MRLDELATLVQSVNRTLEILLHAPEREAQTDHRKESPMHDGASYPGVNFAYDVAVKQVDNQADVIDRLNTKLAFLLGGALTGIAAYADKVQLPAGIYIVGPLLLAVALCGFFGYISRTYMRPPMPLGIAKRAKSWPGATKEAALGTLIEAHDINSEIILSKSRWFNTGLWIGMFTIVLVVVGKFFISVDSSAHTKPGHTSIPVVQPSCAQHSTG